MVADIELTGPPLDCAGLQLRRAREAAGKSLADIAAATRIPERLLAAIEASQYSALPSRTYAIGFSRSFARVVGLDETTIADEVRHEMDGAAKDADTPQMPAFVPGDPARVPGRRLATIAGLAAAAVAIAAMALWHTGYAPQGELPSILPANAPQTFKKPGASNSAALPGRAANPAAPTGGAVTLTALEPGIWVKVYEAAGKTLFEKQMTQGQAFTVPADARSPLIWTGRPDALAISIGGKPVAKLADKQKTMKGAPISAAALLARPASPPALPGPTPTPVPRVQAAPAPVATASPAGQ